MATNALDLVSSQELEDRLTRLGWVVTAQGCWEWSRSSTAAGYGILRIKGKTILAHRASHELWVGPIPDAYYVCHSCDNPPCMNPSHLFTGTPSENNLDASSKGKNIRSLNPGSRLTDDQVRDIRRHLKAGVVQRRLAEKYGVSPQTITNIKQGKQWTTLDKEDVK